MTEEITLETRSWIVEQNISGAIAPHQEIIKKGKNQNFTKNLSNSYIRREGTNK